MAENQENPEPNDQQKALASLPVTKRNKKVVKNPSESEMTENVTADPSPINGSTKFWLIEER